MILMLVLHVTEGFDKALNMTVETKLEFGRTLKSTFRGRVKLAQFLLHLCRRCLVI